MKKLIRNKEFSKIFNLKNLLSCEEGHGISKNKGDSADNKNNEHCSSFGSHCCLNCDKCWGRRYKRL